LTPLGLFPKAVQAVEDMSASGLTALERDALALMLSAAPFGSQFSLQVAAATVRQRDETGVGIFVELHVPDHLSADKKERITVSNLDGQAENLQHGFGGVLFIECGKLRTLEFFTYDELWPRELVNYRLCISTNTIQCD